MTQDHTTRPGILEERREDDSLELVMAREAIANLEEMQERDEKRIEDLEAEVERMKAALTEIAATQWREIEPGSSWCPDEGQAYVAEMEAFANWAITRAKEALSEAVHG